jgi:hypothetical protein
MLYDFVLGCTGLFGKSERSFALMLRGAGVAFGVRRGAGWGVGGIATGRAGAGSAFGPAPVRGPGDAAPLGPGLGAVPAVRATAAGLVALGLGTPARGAGGAETRAAGAVLGAALARATAAAEVGDARGTAGAGVAACALGRTTGAGLAEGRADGALVGTGEGAAVGGCFTATATGATVGTVTGAAGSVVRGCVS